MAAIATRAEYDRPLAGVVERFDRDRDRDAGPSLGDRRHDDDDRGGWWGNDRARPAAFPGTAHSRRATATMPSHRGRPTPCAVLRGAGHSRAALGVPNRIPYVVYR